MLVRGLGILDVFLITAHTGKSEEKEFREKKEKNSPDLGLVSSISPQTHSLRVNSSIILTNLQVAHLKLICKIYLSSPNLSVD